MLNYEEEYNFYKSGYDKVITDYITSSNLLHLQKEASSIKKDFKSEERIATLIDKSNFKFKHEIEFENKILDDFENEYCLYDVKTMGKLVANKLSQYTGDEYEYVKIITKMLPIRDNGTEFFGNEVKIYNYIICKKGLFNLQKNFIGDINKLNENGQIIILKRSFNNNSRDKLANIHKIIYPSRTDSLYPISMHNISDNFPHYDLATKIFKLIIENNYCKKNKYIQKVIDKTKK